MDIKENLLIWDVDGTLLTCYGSGKRAFNITFEELYGVSGAFDKAQMAGAVDGALLCDAWEFYGIQRRDRTLFYSKYKEHLKNELEKADAFIVHKGVKNILSLTDKAPQFYNILGTGNCFEGAFEKLRITQLERYFKTGAYGSEAQPRSKVIFDAYHKGCICYEKEFLYQHTWVIGDTPADIISAKENGFNAVAVATGAYAIEELKKWEPEILLNDLTDPNVLIKRMQDW